MNRGFLMVAMVLLTCPVAAGQFNTRVSQSESGVESNSFSRYCALSANGRYVAFASDGDNLVPGDTNDAFDVFVLDRATGDLERVSVDATGLEGNADSRRPSISHDGRHVAFESEASNLAGSTPSQQVFVKDRLTGDIVMASVDSTGLPGDDDSDHAVISGNGQVVAFQSEATNFIANDFNGVTDVYVHDLGTGVTQAASVHPVGSVAANGGIQPAVTYDGTRVVFRTFTRMVPGDRNNGVDIYLRDLTAQTTTLASADASGFSSFAISTDGRISADGRHVAFSTAGNDLGPVDTNGSEDVYVRDLQTGVPRLVLFERPGVQALGNTDESDLSADGGALAVRTRAGNLDPGDQNGVEDVYLVDLNTLQNRRLSFAYNDADTDAKSEEPVISADGRVAAFGTLATNVVPGDTNMVKDIIVNAPELTLEALPASVPFNASFTLSTWRGNAGDRAFLYVIDVSGIPFLFRVQSGAFDATGQFHRTSTYNDPIVQGLTITYMSFAVGPRTGKFTATNPASVTFE